jgi:glycosyltransferase involved in cell wall biosynthesis
MPYALCPLRVYSMSKSILFLTNAYPDFEDSYRGIFIKEMVSLLEKEGYHISVVTPHIYRKSRYFEEENRISVLRFPFFSGNRSLIEYKRVPYVRMVLYFLSGLLTAVYTVVKNRCSLIHVHWAIPTGIIGVWIRFILGKPLLVTIHGSDLRMATEKLGLIRRLFIHVCHKATHLNCVSEVQRNEITQMGILSNKISVIPMGVGKAFVEIGTKREPMSNQDVITILSNRNLLPIYNLSLLIRAIPAVVEREPRVKFVIAGNGPEQEKLKKEVKEFKIENSVCFLGQVAHTDMPRLLSQADIYVSTSLSDGTSVSLLEAMASGAFPIVTDIPANREWITDGENGFLIPIDNERILTKRILDAICNQEIVEEARERNQRIIEERAYWIESIRKTTSLYEDITSSR